MAKTKIHITVKIVALKVQSGLVNVIVVRLGTPLQKK